MSELLKINVNQHCEKKNGLTYLSWAWAWAEVLKADPGATWNHMDFTAGGEAVTLLAKMDDGTALVGVEVVVKGTMRSCTLPVMDHRNKAIANPNAFDVNKAQMRCLAKAIAMHGLGLYIYAGEDLPEAESDNGQVSPEADEDLKPALRASIERVKQLKAGVMSATLPAVEASLDTNTRIALNKLAERVTKLHTQGAFTSAYEAVKEQGLSGDETVYLWSLLDSAVRSRMKREKEEASMRDAVERAKETT